VRQIKANGTSATGEQKKEIADRKLVLRDKLNAWLPLRLVYLPGLHQFLKDDRLEIPPGSIDSSTEVDEVLLYLPSSIPTAFRRAVCTDGLSNMEEHLRLAQCNDSLQGVKHTLRIRTRMIQWKNKNIRGQRDGVRSRTVIDRIHGKARKAVAKYRVARSALYALRGGGAWEEQLRELEDGDVRSYSDIQAVQIAPGRRGTVEEDAEPRMELTNNTDDMDISLEGRTRTQREGTGRTRMVTSWIWQVGKTNIDDTTDSNDDILRSEWCKSRARARRGTEQVEKTREEMRRTLEFLKWKGAGWSDREHARVDVKNKALLEGLHAYAAKQALIQDSLRTAFRELWRTPLSRWDNDDNNDDNDDGEAEGLDENTHRGIWDNIQGGDDEDSDTEVMIRQ